MQTTEKLALDVAEAAELLGISKPTMYNICNRADFTAMFKIGTRTKIHPSLGGFSEDYGQD